MKTFARLLLALILVTSIASSTYFASSRSVQIENEGDHVFFSPKKTGTVKINFNDSKLYNERVVLSYHVYSGKKMILWEGLRTPVLLKNGVYYSNYMIDLNSVPNLTSHEELTVVFDLVDEKNVYWMSQNPSIKLSSVEMDYSKNAYLKALYPYQRAISESPVILIINLVVCVLAVVGVRRFIKSIA